MNINGDLHSPPENKTRTHSNHNNTRACSYGFGQRKNMRYILGLWAALKQEVGPLGPSKRTGTKGTNSNPQNHKDTQNHKNVHMLLFLGGGGYQEEFFVIGTG